MTLARGWGGLQVRRAAQDALTSLGARALPALLSALAAPGASAAQRAGAARAAGGVLAGAAHAKEAAAGGGGAALGRAARAPSVPRADALAALAEALVRDEAAEVAAEAAAALAAAARPDDERLRARLVEVRPPLPLPGRSSLSHAVLLSCVVLIIFIIFIIFIILVIPPRVRRTPSAKRAAVPFVGLSAARARRW